MCIMTAVPPRRMSGLGLLTLLACCGSLACGDPTYRPPPVGGVVVWQDGTEPRELEGGAVEFEANGSVVASAPLTADGTFQLMKTLPLKTYRVRITAPPDASGLPILDTRFMNFDTSGLEFTATSVPQPVTFRISRRGS